MSRSAISHYSSRSLDACTLQLGSWNPFLPPSSASPDPSFHPVDQSCLSPDDEFADLSHLLRAKCSFKQIMKRSLGSDRLRWSCPPFQDLASRLGAQSWIPSTYEQHVEMATKSGPAAHVPGVCGVSERLAKGSGNSCHNDSNKLPSSMEVLAPSLGSWSKKHKQLSSAFARGLWGWRECSRASKRRRKCGSSRSGSSRSSDSRRGGQRPCLYDPTIVAAAYAYATCSDFPIPATDSSGELFFNGEGSWDPDSSCGEGVAHKRDCIDVYHAWLTTETQSLESGYGSEPGYRGDGELGYEDDDGFPDEPDEEEKEPLHLSPWRDSVTETVTSKTISELEMLDEDCIYDLTSSSDLKMQSRLRRRRQEGKLCNGQKSRHL